MHQLLARILRKLMQVVAGLDANRREERSQLSRDSRSGYIRTSRPPKDAHTGVGAHSLRIRL